MYTHYAVNKVPNEYVTNESNLKPEISSLQQFRCSNSRKFCFSHVLLYMYICKTLNRKSVSQPIKISGVLELLYYKKEMLLLLENKNRLGSIR
jgi:hypothetical protein